jgi:hypothetical protein
MSGLRKNSFGILRRSAMFVCMIMFADAVGVGVASMLFGQNLFLYASDIA